MAESKSNRCPHRCATLLAVVAEIHPQRSAALRLLNHEGWQPVGNVTIPTNHKVPAVGAVVEVRFLHAHRDGSLYQPVYLGERSDVRQDECVVSQLKFKQEEMRMVERSQQCFRFQPTHESFTTLPIAVADWTTLCDKVSTTVSERIVL